MAASSSGSRRTTVVRRPPSAGRRLQQLRPGQGQARRSGAWAVASRWSRKSSSPSSACWASSITSTTALCRLGEVLEERRPGGEQVLTCERARTAGAEQDGEPRPKPVPVVRVGDQLGQPGVQPLGHDVAGVGLEQPEPGAQRLGECPERDPVAVGQAPAPVPPDAWQPARRRTSRTPRPAGTCPPRPRRRGPPAGAGCDSSVPWNSSLTRRRSASRPGERRLQPVDPLPTADVGDDDSRPPTAVPARPCPSAGARRCR